MPPIEEPATTATRITVDGTPYVLPPLDTFDLDEAMVMYEYSKLTFDQIFELEGLHPGVVAGLLHVAIQRSDLALRPREVKDMVRKVNMMNVLEQLADAADQQPDPTQGEVPKLDDDSKTSKPEATEPSGDSSEVASEPSLESVSPDSSGTPDSDTSAISAQVTSAV